MNRERKQVDREAAIQGARWNIFHDGYFSDPQAAEPFLICARRAMAGQPPDVLADLGGGTGFLLTQLLADCPPTTRLVNVDISPRQLSACAAGRIEHLRKCVSRVTRSELGVADGRLMLLMRSVLHYFGRSGLRPLLKHLRSQASRGEMLIHQTACFAEARGGDCLNALYQKMRTEKWYPEITHLRAELEACGWRVVNVIPAPPLPLTAADLSLRYQLSPEDVATIRDEMVATFGNLVGIFTPEPGSFTAFLHYSVFSCKAM